VDDPRGDAGVTGTAATRWRVARRDPPVARPGQFAALGGFVIACALFLTPYLTWRVLPDMLFTISDALFLFGALLLLAGNAINADPLRGLTLPWMGGLLVMLLGLLIASILNDDAIRWLIVAAQYFMAYAVLPLLVMQRDADRSIAVVRPLLYGVLAMELVGIVVYFITGGSRDATMWLAHEFITGTHRLGAFMADANWNAAMIAVILPFLLYLSRVRAIGPILTYGGMAVLGTALLLSGSFTGFTSAVAAMLVFMLVAGGTQTVRIASGIALAVVVAFAMGVTLPPVFQARVAGAFETGDLNQAGTFVGRWELIKEAWGIVNQTTWVGLGVDRYRVVSADQAPVHNIYLLLWAEGGLIALLGWLTMMMVPLVSALRALRYDRAAAALGLAVLVAFFAFSLASPHLYARSFIAPLILAIGITLSAGPRYRDPDEDTVQRRGTTPFGRAPRRKPPSRRGTKGVA
jgi:O-antigen ligase